MPKLKEAELPYEVEPQGSFPHPYVCWRRQMGCSPQSSQAEPGDSQGTQSGARLPDQDIPYVMAVLTVRYNPSERDFSQPQDALAACPP